MISSGLNSVPSVGISKTGYTNSKERTSRARVSQETKCDSVSISSNRENRVFMDVVSCLSREVRTAVSTSDIRALREEVASGRYTPDPAQIAANMLFLKESL
ncbi:MAG: flagellar biosynthesis anti-sigma factor FlgM [Clostridiales bacterium]|nr:flagellar biosynthesis anti-sigma factor FlgM [Clostridiales bacterium]